MDDYAIALFLHIVGAVGFFVALGLEWTGLRQIRSAMTPEQVAARAEAAKKAAEDAAAAAGEPCEKAGEPAVKAGCDAPVQNDTIYLIRGTGAVIQS